MSGCDSLHCGMIGGYLDDEEARTIRVVKMLNELNSVPALSCGMNPGLINHIKGVLGHSNWMANVGGAIYSHPMGTGAGVRAMKQAITGEYGQEYGIAVNKWGLR